MPIPQHTLRENEGARQALAGQSRYVDGKAKLSESSYPYCIT
jgi:hypothetical protein